MSTFATNLNTKFTQQRAFAKLQNNLTFHRLPFVSAICAGLAIVVMGYTFYGGAAVAVTVYCLLWYLQALGREIAIVPAMSFIASAQWLLGPFFAYEFDAITIKYFMYVPEPQYFDFVLPAVLAMIIGLKVFAPRIEVLRLRDYLRTHVRLRPTTIYALFITSMAIDFLPGVPSALGFAVFLVSQFTFVAIIYMLAFRLPGRWLALFAGFGMMAFQSAEAGLFHNMLLWSALILSYVCMELRLAMFAKIGIVLIGFLAIFQLQLTKAQYRIFIEQNPSEAGLVTLVEMMITTPVGASATNELIPDYGLLNARLNQGWIISAVMNHVPDVVPHAGGSTIALAFRDSIAPRFLVDKKAIDVSETYRTYTGLGVNRNTSFGISVLGEAWVNFGHWGILFMGLFGAFFGFVIRGVLWASRIYPTLVLWTPLLFLQAIKAETELVVVLNHISKSAVLVLVLYFLCYKFLRLRI